MKAAVSSAQTPSAKSFFHAAITLLYSLCIISIISYSQLIAHPHHDLFWGNNTSDSLGHYGVAINGEGTCFVACGADGIRAYEYGEGFLTFLAQTDDLPNANDVAVDRDGYIYAVGNGLSMYSFSGGKFTLIAHRDDVYGNLVAVDSTSTVFVVHSVNYIRSFIQEDSTFIQTAEMVNYPDDLMYNIAINNGTIFVASDYRLTAYTHDDSSFSAVAYIYCENEWGAVANDVAIDNSGVIYLAADSTGITRWHYNNASFTSFDSQSYGANIKCVDAATGGLIVTWGDDNTLSVYQSDTSTQLLKLLDDDTAEYPILDIAIDDSGYIISTKAEHGMQLHQYIEGEGISARDAVSPNLDISWEKQIIDNDLIPSVLTVADLDGDDNPDIVATAWELGDVVWYRNDCDSRIWTKQAFNASLSDPIGVGIGDVNNDAQPDVIVASRGSNEIVWFENALASPQSTQWTQHLLTNSISSPNQVYVADLNNDDNLDVVVSPAQGNSIYWVENGGGAQGPWQVYTIDSTIVRPRKLAVGDVNGDGAIDIAAASSDLNELRLYMTGGGTPLNWTTYTVDNSLGGARAVFMRDVDGDGDLDIAATGVKDNSIVYYENAGSDPSTWPKHVVDSTFVDARVVSIADINNGGLPDIIASSTSQNRLVWFDHESNWQLVEVPEASVSGARSFIVADMDNDKDLMGQTDLDIVVAAQGSKDVIIFRSELVPTAPILPVLPAEMNFGEVNTGETVQLPIVLSNHGTGVLHITAEQLENTGTNPFSIEGTLAFSLGKCDIDSILISCTPTETGIYRDTLHITSNDSNTVDTYIELIVNSTAPLKEVTWEKQIIDNDLSPSVLTVADLDGDDNPDIVATAWELGDVVWYRNDCDSRVWTKQAFNASLSDPIGVSVGDVNNDAQPDVIVASRGSNEIVWFENALTAPQSTQWTQHLLTNSISSPNQVYVADLNNDDDLDVVVSPAQGNSIYWVENRGGTQGPWQVYTIDSTIVRPRKLAVGDVNGDGAIDIAAASSDLNEIRLYMTSGGTPLNWTTYTIDNSLGGARAVFMRDVDGDGDLDIAATGVKDNSIVYYENAGSDPSTWPKHVVDSTFVDARVVSIADINNGGLPDIIASSTSQNRLVWFDHESNWQLVEVPEASVSGARSFIVADMDNDKDLMGQTDLDIVVAAQGSNDVLIFHNELVPAIPEISFQQTALNFGEVNVGDTLSLSLILTNSGTGLLQISAIQIQGPVPLPFSIEDSTALSLSSCDVDSIVIMCAPVDTGIWTGTLIINSNDHRDSVVTIDLMVDCVTDIEDAPLPRTLQLAQNYPNPFNPITEITYELPSLGNVRLSVHDLLGREVAVLINEPKPAGAYQVRFDASGLPSGVYIYRLQWNGQVLSRKMVLLR